MSGRWPRPSLEEVQVRASAVGRTVLLRDLTTLRIGGPAELWEVEGSEELAEATRRPYRILGGGSNLLVSDSGVPERVVKLGRSFSTLEALDGSVEPWVGAATPLPGLVRRAQRLGLSGLEGLLGIPGVVGGAVVMNAGTRFGSIADILTEVGLYLEGRSVRLPVAEVGFGYRSSELPPGAVVTKARFRLVPSTPERVAKAMEAPDEARRGQPKIKSAGCAFKNPPHDSAGHIIDLHGLKGLRVGDAMVSHEHGNFIVNLGNATSTEVLRLIDEIRSRIDIPLQMEWHVWGQP